MTPDSRRILARFKSWEEIFPDSAEADRQYSALLEKLRAEYSGSQTLLRERVEVNPQTGLAATIFEKNIGGFTRVERLPGGNVRYEFNHPGVRHIQEIIPEAGNKDHGWTYNEIVDLQAQVALALVESPDPNDGLKLATMLSYLRGKPACVEWEETMLFNKVFPQRVGFEIYPDWVLSAARARVKK